MSEVVVEGLSARTEVVEAAGSIAGRAGSVWVGRAIARTVVVEAAGSGLGIVEQLCTGMVSLTLFD